MEDYPYVSQVPVGLRRWVEGGCAVLAHHLHLMTGWPLFGWASEEERQHPHHAEFPHFDHVFVQHPSGQALDVRGLHPMPDGAESLTPEHQQELFENEAFRGWPGDYDPQYGSSLIDPPYDDDGAYAQELLRRVDCKRVIRTHTRTRGPHR